MYLSENTLNANSPNHDVPQHYDTTTKWTRFIGIIYILTGISLLALFILMITQMDEIAQLLMSYYGISQQVIDLIANWGKIIFGIIMAIIAFTFFINAYFLLQARSNYTQYRETKNESYLATSFENLGSYFVFSTILSIISTLSSIGLILFTLFK